MMRGFNYFKLQRSGAVLIEFALILPVIILINILIYDLGSYYRLSETSKHAAQVIQRIISSESDHRVTLGDLDRYAQYHRLVAGHLSEATSTALVVIDTMPLYSNKSWSFIVCWSWSSDPAVMTPPPIGLPLSAQNYPVDPWLPTNGFVASSAIIIVETHQKFDPLMGVEYLPKSNRQSAIGPVRYSQNLPINILLQNFTGGTVLNDDKVRDPNAANAILCQR